MTTKQRLTLWVPTFGFAIYNLAQLDLFTAIAIWVLAVCVELQNERYELERLQAEHARHWAYQYSLWSRGEYRRKPGKVINLRNNNGNEAA